MASEGQEAAGPTMAEAAASIAPTAMATEAEQPPQPAEAEAPMPMDETPEQEGNDSSNGKKVFAIVPPRMSRKGAVLPPVVLEAVEPEGPPREPWQLQRYYTTQCGAFVIVRDRLGLVMIPSAAVWMGSRRRVDCVIDRD